MVSLRFSPLPACHCEPRLVGAWQSDRLNSKWQNPKSKQIQISKFKILNVLSIGIWMRRIKSSFLLFRIWCLGFRISLLGIAEPIPKRKRRLAPRNDKKEVSLRY